VQAFAEPHQAGARGFSGRWVGGDAEEELDDVLSRHRAVLYDRFSRLRNDVDSATSEPVLAGLLRHDGQRPEVELGEGGALVARLEAERIEAFVLGEVAGRAAVDRLLGTFGVSGAELIARLFLRFGVDGFLRVGGDYAAAVIDREAGRVVLAVSAGGIVPLFVLRDGRRTRFSSSLVELARAAGAKEAETEAIGAYVACGLWPSAEKSLFRGIEAVAPGTALVIEKSGRAKRRAFSTFSPLVIPRELNREAALAEVDAALGRAIAKADLAGKITVVARDPSAILRHLPRTAHVQVIPPPEGGSIEAAAALAGGPIALSELREAAALRKAGDRSVISDLGAAELFGETPLGRWSFVAAVTRAFEAEPSLTSARTALTAGAHAAKPTDRAFWAELGGGVSRLLRRWSRHAPAEARDLLLRALPEGRWPYGQVPEMTGNPYVDFRFAQVRDPSLAARARAAGSITPYLDQEVIETVFSLPPEHFAPNRGPLREPPDAPEDRHQGTQAVIEAVSSSQLG
jgi:hypothetical protein